MTTTGQENVISSSNEVAVEKKSVFWKIGDDFYCPKCKFLQRSVFYFEHHMETGHKTSLPLCFKCKDIFDNETELEENTLPAKSF